MNKHVEVLKEDLIRQAKYVPRAIILIPLLLLAILFIKENNKEQIKSKLFGTISDYKLMFFLFWLAFILMSTIFSRWTKTPYRNILGGFGLRTNKGWNTEAIENIVLFVPYTFLYIGAFRPEKPWISALKISFISTVTIELFQLLFWLGSFQLSDILHNVEGGMLGCGLWCLTHFLIAKLNGEKSGNQQR